jgi:hypothetical protein
MYKSLLGENIRVKTCSTVKIESRWKDRDKLWDCVSLHKKTLRDGIQVKTDNIE